MGYPHGFNGNALSNGTWLNANNAWHATYWSRAGNPMYAASIDGGKTWAVSTITGAAGLEIGDGDLFVEPDDHNFLEIFEDGQSLVHIMGNMHDINDFPYINGSFFGWNVSPALPSEFVRNSYPVIRRTATCFFLYCRSGPENFSGSGDNRSGAGDSRYWWMPLTGSSTWQGPHYIYQGVSVPGGGPGGTTGTDFNTDDEYNWSSYPNFFVEPANGIYPHPNRLWVVHLWRATGTPLVNERPQVMYTDDPSDPTAWRAPNGTPVTLPVTPVNNPDTNMGWDHAHVGEYLNAGSICVNPETGQPEVFLSRNPFYHMVYDPDLDSWTRVAYGSPAGLTLAGWVVGSQLLPYFVDGEMWLIGVATDSKGRHPRIWNLAGTKSFPMGGMVPYTAMGTGENFGGAGSGFELPGWEVQCDSESWRRFGRITIMTPNKNIPRLFHFGTQPRRVIA